MNIYKEYCIKKKIRSLSKEKIELLDFVIESVGAKVKNPEDYLGDFEIIDRKIQYLTFNLKK